MKVSLVDKGVGYFVFRFDARSPMETTLASLMNGKVDADVPISVNSYACGGFVIGGFSTGVVDPFVSKK